MKTLQDTTTFIQKASDNRYFAKFIYHSYLNEETLTG